MTLRQHPNKPAYSASIGRLIDYPIHERIRLGALELRLAKSSLDIEAAQRLRYRVFYEEMGATPSKTAHTARLDCDEYDEDADHLLVIDNNIRKLCHPYIKRGVVGTYRLLQKHQITNRRTFYTASEFDITKILTYPGQILELGRSCVDAEYRSRTILQLMWQGIASYIYSNNIDLMFGCASFPSSNMEEHRFALDYLKKNHQAPDLLCPRALPEHYINMSLTGEQINRDGYIVNDLPPLIKGYLRLGGWVGDGAVVDHQFNTTDVCVIVKRDNLPKRYRNHYIRKQCELSYGND
ncbi:MAG: hemolysin-like protein [Rhodospirillaceae bacterium]|nr:hemolysin-like protein [Rhodospirillaceae bacterium]|tara:strand:+ start:2707 stop:3591 length:885 start_codon:yes stop_codon:yes gene_type:complete